MSKSERVTDTDGLLLCNRMAQSLNRNMDPQVLKAVLRPDGKHLVVLMLPFHNEADHHRCMVYASVITGEDPWDFMLDIPVHLFEQMETVTDHLGLEGVGGTATK